MNERKKLQELARAGKMKMLLPATADYHSVDMSSTADVWGEGPNVDGLSFGNAHNARPESEVLADLENAIGKEEAEAFIWQAKCWATPQEQIPEEFWEM